MDELTKLENWLKKNRIPYERDDQEPENGINWHQISVPSANRKSWDAVCHYGSYGYKEGLLEIMGELVTAEDGDFVCGHLTADEVIKRAEEWAKKEKMNG